MPVILNSFRTHWEVVLFGIAIILQNLNSADQINHFAKTVGPETVEVLNLIQYQDDDVFLYWMI